MVYYAKTLLQDLPRGHRKEDDKVYSDLEEKASSYKGQKYEEADDKYVELITKIADGEAELSLDLKHLSPGEKRSARINKICQEMEKLSRQPIQYDEEADFDLKSAVKGLAFAMTASAESENSLPPVNSRRAKQMLWTNSLRLIVEISAEEEEQRVKHAERFAKAAKVFLEATEQK